jgi:hypothetical protein
MTKNEPPLSTLVLGIGSGRCGTQSLADMLNQQAQASCTHERFRAEVPWGFEGYSYLKDLINASTGECRLFGDVSLYWLPQVERLIEEFPINDTFNDLCIIALKRNKSDTVDSFWRKTGRANGRNHWQLHNGEQFKECELGWDKCFPKFDASSKREAIEMYWSYYYGEVARLEDKYPDFVRCFSTEALNSEEGQREILTFVGIAPEQQVLQPGIRKNTLRPHRSMAKRIVDSGRRVLKQVF